MENLVQKANEIKGWILDRQLIWTAVKRKYLFRKIDVVQAWISDAQPSWTGVTLHIPNTDSAGLDEEDLMLPKILANWGPYSQAEGEIRL